VKNITKLLRNGIGYHHSGILPIVKDCVEFLFQNGLIKILFATESLAIGINMPTKTVVFTRMQKFDGNYRCINNSEFIQMSGRSGRRGKDSQGLSIMMLDDNKSSTMEDYKNLLNCKSEKLYSHFHLRYYQILSIIKTQNTASEYIGKKSFYQFQVKKGAPLKKTEIMRTYIKYNKIVIPNVEEDNEEILNLLETKEDILENIQEIVFECRNKIWAKSLEPGRIIKFKNNDWGILINLRYVNSKSIKQNSEILTNLLIKENLKDFICEIFIQNNNLKMNLNIDKKIDNYNEIKSIPLSDLTEISKVKVDIPKNSNGKNFLKSCEKKLMEVKMMIKDKNLQIFNPITDFEIKNNQLEKLNDKLNFLNSKINLKEEKNSLLLKSIMKLKSEKKEFEKTLNSNFKELEKIEEFELKEDVEKMEHVLIELSYVTSNKLTSKGQLASIISAGDEIVLTELVFKGVFDKLESIQIIALLSCFVKESGRFTKDNSYMNIPDLSPVMNLIYNEIKEVFYDVSKIYRMFGIKNKDFDEEFKPHFMEPSFMWANGSNLLEICNCTEIYEGNLISCFKRLDELISQLIEGCQKIEKYNLKEIFKQASSLINRGMVADKSLLILDN